MKAKIVENYIERMKASVKLMGAMVVGSYVTGTMGPNSDIDIFFLTEDETKSIRGRERFMGIEFEYFMSPEWKYYDRLNRDTTSIRIYSEAEILFDTDGTLKKIIEEAQRLKENYRAELNDDRLRDMKFYIETIYYDAIDLYKKGSYSDFLIFTYSSLQKLCDILCKLKSELPVYIKYGISEIKIVDEAFGEIVEQFLKTDYRDENKLKLWMQICNDFDKYLNHIDIDPFESIQEIHREN